MAFAGRSDPYCQLKVSAAASAAAAMVALT
jgi:hypothetical protein